MDVSSEGTTPQYSFSRKSPFQCDNWELREGSLPALQDVAASESLFAIGNGFIGIRGFPEESDNLLNTAYYRNQDFASNANSSSNTAGTGANMASGHHRTSTNPTSHYYAQGGGNPTSAGQCGRYGVGSPRSTDGGSRTNSNYAQSAGSQGYGGPSSPGILRGGSRPGSQVSSPLGASHTGGPTTGNEPLPGSAPFRGCCVAGFYEHSLLLNRTRAFTVGQCSKEGYLVRAPNPLCIDVFVGGEHVSSATGKILSHSRKLDIRTGELRRRMVWESHTHPNREVTIESSRFTSAKRRNIAAVRLRVSARNVSSTDIRILSRTEVPDDPTTRRSCGIENIFTRFNIQEAASVVQVRTRNSCRHLTVAAMETCQSVQCSEKAMKQFSGASVTSLGSSASGNDNFGTSPPNGPTGSGPTANGAGNVTFPVTTAAAKSISTPTSLAPKCNETDMGTETFFTSIISDRATIELHKIIGFFGDDDAMQEDLGEVAVQRTREAAAMGYDALAQESRTEMNRFWETADIRYKGSSSIQGAFRYNMLQLQNTCGTSSQYGFPTRGLTGENMGGAHQWDVDTFIIPCLTHTCPEKARALLQFRINTLYQAKSIANDLDLPRGAVYPFRTITGTENPAPYCAAFLFVNAVIAYAMRQYVLATNDYSILAEGGAEVALSTALVWLEWGTWEQGQFHLRSVAGPDMYAGDLNDNFFTNLMAQQHMQWMVQVAAYFRETWLIRWKEILEHSLATENDIAELDRAASCMVLPFDGNLRVHPVDELFMRKKPWQFEDLNAHHKEALMHRYHPSVIYRHRVCRIPDVLLAMMLQPERFTQDEFKGNFNFYSAITSNDSALRRVINSVIAAQLRIMDMAMPNFTGSLFVDLDNVLGNTGSGMHLTTAAGSWWGLAVGFGGMRVVQGTLHFNPTLPDDCEEVQFFARHRGCLIRVVITQRMVTYTLESNAKDVEDLLLIHAESSRIHLRKGIPETVRLFREIRVFDFDSVVFEMDSIIVDIEDFHYDAWKETLESYFHETDLPTFTMSKELYLAYLRHMKPVTGLTEIFKRFDRSPLPAGSHDDSETAHTANGLLTRKLLCFRRIVKERGLHFREGLFQLLANLRQCGIAIGCVSGSKNGRWMLEQTPELRFMFDDFLDRNDGDDFGLRWRPEADYFDACAKNMDCALDRAILVMDGTDGFSKSCLEKFCLIVDVSTDPEEVQLDAPRVFVQNFTDLTMEALDEYTARDGVVHHRQASAYRRSNTKGNSNSDYVSSQASPINNISSFPDALPVYNTSSGVNT